MIFKQVQQKFPKNELLWLLLIQGTKSLPLKLHYIIFSMESEMSSPVKITHTPSSKGLQNMETPNKEFHNIETPSKGFHKIETPSKGLHNIEMMCSPIPRIKTPVSKKLGHPLMMSR